MSKQNEIEQAAQSLSERWAAYHAKRAAERSFKTPESTEREREYWNTVWGTTKATAATAMPSLKQEMSFDEARAEMKKIFIARTNELSTLKNAPFVWSFSDEQKEILWNLLRWFINDPQSVYPLHKGLYLYGAFGCGKTEIMQLFQRFAEVRSLTKSFQWSNLSEMYDRAAADKNYNPI